MRIRRIIAVTLVAAVVAMGAAGCDVRVAGRRCSVAGATAQDATHVLVCTKGRWTRSITKVQAALILLSVIRSKTAIGVDAGNNHTCATMDNGDVRCWGFNSSGQLGNGTNVNSRTPVLVTGATVRGVSRTSAGSGPTELTGRVEVGAEHGCLIQPEKFAATTLSKLRCWGSNGFGQLGDGTTTNRSTIVETIGSGVVTVATGTVHTCASTEFFGVTCWGQNSAGQLGDGTTNSSAVPVAVTGMSITSGHLAAGNAHTCLLSTSLWCWGGNGSGQLGDGTTTQRLTPVPVPLDPAWNIAAGGDTTCALLMSGGVSCWGANESGQVGDGTTTSRSTPTPVSGVAGATAVTVGAFHSCAIVTGGEVRCWGFNATGQLGDGTTTDRSLPVAVPGLTKVTAISAGVDHTCAVSEGAVWCWGRNEVGAVGDGTTAPVRLTPVKVTFG